MAQSEMSQGLFWGIVSAATFGLIPLFTLPLLSAGLSPETILFYRFAIALIIMLPIMLVKREKLGLRPLDHMKLAGLSIMYMLAALLYFHAFRYLPSGVVTTLQYLYPLMVMVIMILFFHEKFSWSKVLAIGLALIGVALLANINGSSLAQLSVTGICYSLLTGLFYALYYVGIKFANLSNISGLAMTFHVMIWGTFICFINALATDSFQFITQFENFEFAFMLALVTAVFSNFTLIIAIKHVGPTMTSIVGAAEPLTAVCVGMMVFGETFTFTMATGFALVIAAVTIAMILEN